MVDLQYNEGASLPPNAPAWAVSASERLKDRRDKGMLLAEGPPEGIQRILLHSCCAPCSGAMVEEMVSYKQVEVVVFFYNPNIHPRREYEIRKEENKRFCQDLNVEFVDCDYDADNWYERTKGMEMDPERGRRCTECFDMRMERTALYAHENRFDAIATTNATSRWKDSQQVDAAGTKAVAEYEKLIYYARNWQTDVMTLRKYQISADNKFYKQEYCGCSYSLRDSNEWRKANGIPKIKIGGEQAGLGNRYFSDPLADALEESQDVVDEFFHQAQEVAAAGDSKQDRKKALETYKDRRKNQKEAGIEFGLNNW
ncbi:Epoxyqueuosine reductase QueH [Seminavis robusta]|uniref:Epoxyqueuosine reductase QueH n=1 Tax=Seminavis robusta TaxID=568900 RepID=A0A9N8DA38_9STRA|nr:Epoxyqueuosine reductase QueH [Seminavis robusta]|eukprot:Sro9_g006960.1 Epoxyqueuosine reductase QueH (313) ;mRNA; f:1821-2759